MSLAWLKVDVVLRLVGKFAATSLLLASFGITGCGDDPVKVGLTKKCTLNSDCNSGLVCGFGLCHQECQVTDDCPAGQRCVKTDDANVCQLNDEAQCHFKSDCEDPLVCAIDLQCRNQCQQDEDCLSGQKCAEGGVCAEPKEVDEEGGLVNAVGAGGDGSGGTSSSGGTSGTGGSSSTGGNMGLGGDDTGEGGMPPVACVPGGDCVPADQPCQLGVIACPNGVETCEPAAEAEDGTDCGADQVCSGGACVACKAGEDCLPDENNVCVAGTLSCANGPSCEASGNVAAGTECGTDKVCSGGSCVACKVGEACDPTNTCKNGVLACAAGPVCNPTTNRAAGFECDTGKVCNSAAACVACEQDAKCEPDNECHQGKQDCATGPNCVDQQLPADDGTSCIGGATYNFCTGGVCLACQQNSACVPPTDPCHKGTFNCNTSPPTCNAGQTNAVDGLACGDNKSCIAGQCLTNDRTLSVTSGAVPDVPIDAPFAVVTVQLLDKNNDPVPSAAITVSPSAGAYALASATNPQGKSTISGRVGRAVGTHKFTVSAPGATSIEFQVNAVAPADDNIFTLVNVNHLSAVPTTPVAGTISKLNSQARAVTAAKDGTLYLADACAVYKLTPQGVLTRIVGDGGCGNSGNNGPGTSAKVYYVSGLALDEVQNYLYVADYNNYAVRLLDLASGKIFGYAGASTNSNVTPWGDPGPADAAFLTPSGVGVAPNGDVFISDSNSGRIRRVDSNTQIDAFLVPGSCSTADRPLTFVRCGAYQDACSFAWDENGQLFISAQFCGDGVNTTFRGVARVNADKSLTRVAGAGPPASLGEGGTATSATFANTPAIAFDKAGNLFVSAPGEDRVRRIDALTDQITTVAGDGTTAYSGEYVLGSAAGMNAPTTLAFDGANNLYFADSGNLAIRGLWSVGDTIAPTGKLAATLGNNQTVKRDATFGPLTVKVTGGNNAAVPGVPVTWKRLETGSGLSSTGASTIVQSTNVQGTTSLTGRVGLASGDYHFEASYTDIHGAAVSGSPQTFAVKAADPDAGIIFPIVNYTYASGLGGPGPATFQKLQSFALGVVVASDGSIYVSDQAAVYKVTTRGEISVFAGTPGNPGYAGDSGPALGAKLYYPEGMAIDETNGVLYIAEQQNRVIRMVSLQTGVINTFAGGGSVTTLPYGDGGPATDANIGPVTNVSVDANGLVYIPDASHNRIRVVDPSNGVISTWLAGNTTCVNGTVQLYTVDQYASVVRFKGDGSAYVSGNLCQGINSTQSLGIALRAANGNMTRVAGLANGTTTENADAIATMLPDLGDFIIDSGGNLVLAMYTQHRVRRINLTTGKINTIAGTGVAAPANQDPGTYVAAAGALLNDPFKLSEAPGGHIVIADEFTYSIRMIW
jgi:sugar lactone lactonase YvrE